MLGKNSGNELSYWPVTGATVNQLNRPSFGYTGAWGVSLKLAGAFPHRTLVWLAFALALALTTVPLVFLLTKGMELTQEVQEVRLQVGLLQQQVERFNRILSDSSGQDLQQQPHGQAKTGKVERESEELMRLKVPKDHTSEYSATAGFQRNNASDVLSVSSRMRRAAVPKKKPLPLGPISNGKKKSVPAFMHLHGDGSSHGQVTDYITSWIQEKWGSTPGNNDVIRRDANLRGMLVTQPGLYLVYMQMTFVSFNQVAVATILAESITGGKGQSRQVASCYVRSKDVDSVYPLTCSTTTVACLNANDLLYIDKVEESVSFSMQAHETFIGVYRLYAAESKQRKSFCPR